ncbi:MAG TPA: transcription termination/antitermination NusG family protein [Roseiarcus sp.]|jgi:transcriptional antiterminator RfaH
MSSLPFWTVARTLPRKEAFAAELLTAAGFKTLFPRVRDGRSGPVPMFVGYLFVQIVEQWRAVDSTIGVMKLVRFGDQPARMPEKEIAALRARMGEDGLIRLPPTCAFAAGDRVRIVGGAFDGLAGVHGHLSAAEPEIVLLTMLNTQRRIKVPTQHGRRA